MKMLLSILMICFSFSTASALTISETSLEADMFSNSNGSTHTGLNFDVGFNTISGFVQRQDAASAGTAGDYGDFWDATLLSGMVITSVDLIYSIEGTQVDPYPWVNVGVGDVRLFSGYTPSYYYLTEWLTAPGTYSLTADVGSFPFPSDLYYFGLGAPFSSAYNMYSYEWQINVASIDTGSSPVPEPSTILLLGSGLLGLLGWYGRKRKKV